MLKNKFQMLYGAFMLVFFWFLLHLALTSSVVPSPQVTLLYFYNHLVSELLGHVAMSFYRIAIAIFLAVGIGLPLGLFMGLIDFGDKVLSPIVYLAYPIPKIAFLPVFMIIFGLGNASKIFLVFSIIVFQVLIGVRDGVKGIPEAVHLSAKSIGLSPALKLWHVILPSIMPKLFSAIRMSTGIGISALFLSENYATTKGIGYYIMNHWIMVDYVAMFAGIVVLSLMGLLIFKCIDVLEAFICPWQREKKSG